MPGVNYATTATFAQYELRETPHTAGALWRELVEPTADRLAGDIVDAVRELVAGETAADARAILRDLVGDALDGALADVLLSLATHTSGARFWSALQAIPSLGSGRPLGLRSSLADIHAVIDVLATAETTPSVAIVLPDGFRDADRSTRTSWCQLVAALGRACDVRLVASRVDRAWLAEYHREDLPGVSERGSSPPQEDALATAAETVGVGSREERVLTHLADTDTETTSNTRLKSMFSVGRSRISQVLGELEDVDLVERYGPDGERRVELTPLGRQFVTEEIARQQRLGDRVSETRKFSNDRRVTPRTHGEGEDRPETATADRTDRHRLPSYHEPRYMDRRTGETALAAAVDADMTLMNYPIDPQEDRAEGRWYAEDDHLVVSAEGDNPLQVWSTLALTLASPRTFDRVLTEDRLADEAVLSMLDEAREIPRDMRQIGWLAEDLGGYHDLRQAFLDAAADFAERTGDLDDADNEEELALRSSIIREARGLAGAMTHLIDLADVELTRVVRLPEFSRQFTSDDDRDGALWQTIAEGTAIASNYGHHATYRQLFEDREDKRQQAFEPTVDAADPVASPIGSWVLVGDFAGRTEAVADDLREAFDDLQPHEDAPEIQLRAGIRTAPSRHQVAETTRRMLATKGLRPTPEAVSVLHALARTPLDVADALQRLGGENDSRRIDAAEVRYALGTLDPNRLLRGFDGRRTTPRRLVSALLEADVELTGEELDRLADVSTRSRRDHLADLIEIELVEEMDAGRYRLALSFGDVDGETEERYSEHYPGLVADPEMSPSVHVAAKVLRVGREHHGPGDPVESPGWPYTGVTEPPDLRELSTPRPYLDDVLPALWGVTERAEYAEDRGVTPAPRVRSATAGPTVEQTPLPDTPETEVSG